MSQLQLGRLDAAGRVRRLLGDSAIYGFAGAFNKLIALVTFPLLSRHLSVADYGAVDVFLISANWLALVVLFGVDSASARLMLDHADDDERAQIVSQSLAWLALVALLVAPLAWWAGPLLGRALEQDAAAALIVPLICLQLPLLVICGLAQGLLRWTFQRRKYLVISLGTSASTALLLSLVIGTTTLRPHHVFVVGIVVQGVFAMLALSFIRRWLAWPHSLSQWRVILPIAIPLGLISAGAAALPIIERSLVAHVPGMAAGDALGLYAAGAKVAGLIALPILAFQSGWGPFMVALSKEREAEDTYNAALLLYVWAVGLLVLALSAAGPWVLRVLASERYTAGAVVVFPLAMALAVQGLGWVFEAGVTISKKTHLSLLAYGSLMVCFVSVAWLLRDPWGLAGVAFAMLAGQAVFAFASVQVAQRAHRLQWRFAAASAILAGVLVAGAIQVATGMRFGPGAASGVGMGAVVALAAAAMIPGPLRSAVTMLRRPPRDLAR